MGAIFDKDYYDDKPLDLEQPLTHARIGYHNIVTPDNVIGSTQASGFEADALGSPDTYEFWIPTELPATINVDAGELVTVDYMGLGVQGLSGCQVVLSGSLDGAEYTEIQTAVLKDDNAAMLLFEPVAYRYFRLVISGWALEPTLLLDFVNQVYEIGDYAETGGATLGVLYIGKALHMQRAIYQGHQPVTLNRNTEIRPARSEGGQWLGRSVVRRSVGTSYTWNNLTAQWYRDNFDPFVVSAITLPFFVAWRPEGYANECVYGWSSGDIQPSNSGPRDLMSVTVSVEGNSNG